jgi:CRP/FNR family transcriptional regulator, cyclic AMP receptor protein
MKVDPAIARIFAENIRAEVLVRPPASKLDPAMVQKITENVRLFRGMSTDCLSRTLSLAENVIFKGGEVAFTEGDLGDSFFVLISGSAVVEKVRDQKTIELAQLSVGDCFGEMALVGRHMRTATVRARRDVVALRFYSESIDAHVEGALAIYRNMAAILAKRLGDASESLVTLSSVSGRS